MVEKIEFTHEGKMAHIWVTEGGVSIQINGAGIIVSKSTFIEVMERSELFNEIESLREKLK